LFFSVNRTTLKTLRLKSTGKGLLIMKTVRLLVADDHHLMREGLRSLLEKEAEFSLVGEAKNGQEIIKLAREKMPHVIVMDVSMPDLNGIEATRQILADNPSIRVVGLSGHCTMAFVRQMLDAGASGYILKSRAYEELTRAVREVVKGKKYLGLPQNLWVKKPS
jgi:two-component system, NarL family, response regulator NreC